MKVTMKLFGYLFVLLVLLLSWQTALAAPAGAGLLVNPQDEFVFGGNYTLPENGTLTGNLWIFGGNAETRPGSRVTGNIFLAGGNLTVHGTVGGDITATGGNIDLRSGAVVQGNINMVGASLSRGAGTRVEGTIQDNESRPFQFTPPSGVPVPQVNTWFSYLLDFVGFVFTAIVISALAMLVVMFAPRHTSQVAATTVSQPLVSGGLGCLTIVVAPVVLGVLAITFILIPVSLLLGILLGLLLLFGWIAVGLEVGKRMAELFKADWPLPISAGIGTLVLTFVIGGLGRALPDIVGWVFPTLVLVVGLGAVLLTRAGTQNYPAFAPLAPAVPGAARTPPTGPEWPVYDPQAVGNVSVYPSEEELKPVENPYDSVITPAPEDDQPEQS